MTVTDSLIPGDILDAQEIREHLRSHLPPPSHLPSTLSALANKLEQYDVEIASLQEKLDQLVAERAAVEAHYTDCDSLLAPIRRLPSEILVEIFALCSTSFAPFEFDAMAILAHAPLLVLSQVCMRWHSVVLGTPALWGEIKLEGTLWLRTAPIHLETIMELLRSALERSGSHPIDLLLSNDLEGSLHPPALALLAQHSARWQKFSFFCQFADLVHLSMLKNNLPRLQSLDIFGFGGDSLPVLEIFQDLPCLERFEFCGYLEDHDIAQLLLLPLEQLTELRHNLASLDDHMPAIMALISRLSRGTTLYLDVSAHGAVPSIIPSIILSDIATLVFETEATCDFSPRSARHTLQSFFVHTTFPSLSALKFGIPTWFSQEPILWPHSHFLSLSERSSFHAHLSTLDLGHIVITQPELLESLATLPALEQLSISDHPNQPLLITDALLGALTRTPGAPCIVPRLCSLHCRSMLQFDDQIFLNCIVSRLEGPPSRAIFECKLWSINGHGRELGPMVAARIGNLHDTKQLRFSFEPAQR